jgi:hypothetical protein
MVAFALNRPSHGILVFEDSIPGICATKAAGMQCIAVEGSHDRPLIAGGVRRRDTGPERYHFASVALSAEVGKSELRLPTLSHVILMEAIPYAPFEQAYLGARLRRNARSRPTSP